MTDPDFQLDARLQSSSFTLLDWPLSHILLKNNADYPWLILVPRCSNVTEIMGLSKIDRHQLIEEIYSVESIMHELLKPDKINTGALGNIVTQLHIHVVGRFRQDPLWPQGIWQTATVEKPYHDAVSLISRLTDRLSTVVF